MGRRQPQPEGDDLYRLSLRIPSKLARRLRLLSADKGISQTEIHTAALTEYLDRIAPDTR